MSDSKSDRSVLLIIFLVVGIVILVSFLIIYNLKHGSSTNSSSTGVAMVDFSDYSEQEINETGTINITSAGVYSINEDVDGAIVINTSGDVKIILNGITINNDSGPSINVVKANSVYIEINGVNTLIANVNEEYNGAIYSKNDLLLYGDGTLNIESNIDGIVTKDDLQINSGTYVIKVDDDGIVGRDSVQINNGTFNIDAGGDGIKSTNEEKGIIDINGGTFNLLVGNDGIQSVSDLNINDGTFDIKTGNGSSMTSTNANWLNQGETESMKGIKAENDLNIKDGKININSEDDSIHSNGNVTIKGGTITISSGDDGIHADKDVLIDDGTIDIKKSYEGIEGANITVNDGDISVVASDDGFNAAGGDGSAMNRPGANNSYASGVNYTLTINGGKIYVNVSGDGLDSNGDIFITGGTIFVDGPTNNGNGALDYGDSGNCKFEISGGTLIAVGSSGMAVSPTSGTTQTSVLINLTNSYSESLTFGDVSYTPSKSYNSILISSSSLDAGKAYTLKIGGKEIQTITLSNTVTTSGSGVMQGGMMQPGGMDRNMQRGGRF